MERIEKSRDVISEFKNLNIDAFFEENKDDFKISTKYIRRKDVLIVVKNFLNSLSYIINYSGEIINPRVLLTTYLIKYFSKHIFGNSDKLTKSEQSLFDNSVEVVEKINNIDYKSMLELCGFITCLNNYKKLFESWKKDDLNSQIDIYMELYLKYDKEISLLENDENSNDYKKHLLEIRDKSKKYIVKLSSEENFNNLLSNKKIVEKNFDDTVENLVKQYLRTAFWEKFKSDISKTPPDYYQLKGIINDIKNYFLKIYKNKEKEKDYICDILDEEFIGNLVENNLISRDRILDICKTILGELRQLDSAVFDKTNIDCTNKLENDENFITNVVNSLKYVMHRLEFLCEIMDKMRKD